MCLFPTWYYKLWFAKGSPKQAIVDSGSPNRRKCFTKAWAATFSFVTIMIVKDGSMTSRPAIMAEASADTYGGTESTTPATQIEPTNLTMNVITHSTDLQLNTRRHSIRKVFGHQTAWPTPLPVLISFASVEVLLTLLLPMVYNIGGTTHASEFPASKTYNHEWVMIDS